MKMSYNYAVSTGNPEGIDWTLTFTHEAEFDNVHFAEIVERLFEQFIKRERPLKIARDKADEKLMKRLKECGDLKPEDMISNSGFVMDADEYITEELEKLGFKKSAPTASYYLEPYWGVDHIKNEELKRLLSDKHSE